LAKTTDFDLIIIGSGPGGYVSAIRAIQRGLKVALVERDKIGGTCLNRGCIPTKALLHDAIRFQSLPRLADLCDMDVKKIRPDFQKVMARKRAAVEKVVGGITSLLTHHGISVFSGKASLIDPRRVLVQGVRGSNQELTSRGVILAVGVVPAPDSPIHIDGNHILSTDDALDLESAPRNLAIIGAGKRGIEFATIFGSFGTEVTVVEPKDRILPTMDRELSVRYKQCLTANKKIKILTRVDVRAVDMDAGELRLSVEGPRGSETVTTEKILYAGKKRPKLEDLALDKINLPLQGGFINVNSYMETAVKGVYAVGDVIGRGCYAHKAYAEAAIAIDHITGRSTKVDYRLIPKFIYTDPEVASIGMTEVEAEAEGEIEVGRFPFIGCGKSIATGEEVGVVKIITGKKYGEILGVHILGPQASELISLASLAMKGELRAEDVRAAVFPHPTYAEAFFEATLDLMEEAIHIMKA
jgi:dihydrolipoamide dehydrogenase